MFLSLRTRARTRALIGVTVSGLGLGAVVGCAGLAALNARAAAGAPAASRLADAAKMGYSGRAMQPLAPPPAPAPIASAPAAKASGDPRLPLRGGLLRGPRRKRGRAGGGGSGGAQPPRPTVVPQERLRRGLSAPRRRRLPVQLRLRRGDAPAARAGRLGAGEAGRRARPGRPTGFGGGRSDQLPRGAPGRPVGPAHDPGRPDRRPRLLFPRRRGQAAGVRVSGLRRDSGRPPPPPSATPSPWASWCASPVGPRPHPRRRARAQVSRRGLPAKNNRTTPHHNAPPAAPTEAS